MSTDVMSDDAIRLKRAIDKAHSVVESYACFFPTNSPYGAFDRMVLDIAHALCEAKEEA